MNILQFTNLFVTCLWEFLAFLGKFYKFISVFVRIFLLFAKKTMNLFSLPRFYLGLWMNIINIFIIWKGGTSECNVRNILGLCFHWIRLILILKVCGRIIVIMVHRYLINRRLFRFLLRFKFWVLNLGMCSGNLIYRRLLSFNSVDSLTWSCRLVWSLWLSSCECWTIWVIKISPVLVIILDFRFVLKLPLSS